jgi:hypothetical protein
VSISKESFYVRSYSTFCRRVRYGRPGGHCDDGQPVDSDGYAEGGRPGTEGTSVGLDVEDADEGSPEIPVVAIVWVVSGTGMTVAELDELVELLEEGQAEVVPAPELVPDAAEKVEVPFVNGYGAPVDVPLV